MQNDLGFKALIVLFIITMYLFVFSFSLKKKLFERSLYFWMFSFQRGSTEGGAGGGGKGGGVVPSKRASPRAKRRQNWPSSIPIIDETNLFVQQLKRLAPYWQISYLLSTTTVVNGIKNSTYRKLKFANTFNTFSQSVYTVINKQFFSKFLYQNSSLTDRTCEKPPSTWRSLVF